MKRILIAATIALYAVAGLAVAQDGPDTIVRSYGSLGESDDLYQGGAIDWYSVTAPEDGRLSVVAVSPDFTPIIVVDIPRESLEEYPGQRMSATAGVPVTAGQQLDIGIAGRDGGAYGAAVTGAATAEYLVVIRMGAGGETLMVGDSVTGVLESGDVLDEDGGYVDYYDLQVAAGERLQIDLSSWDFDTYLKVELPDGRFLDNDDAFDTNSSVSFIASANGIARIAATSYGYVEYGEYTLEVFPAGGEILTVGSVVRANLSGSSDIYVLQGRPGQAVEIELYSTDFDTYLELEDEFGTYLYNDDAEGTSVSRITYVIDDPGEAIVTVSAFGGNTEGAYEISATAVEIEASSIPDGYRLSDGETVSSRLVNGANQIDGAYYQRFTFVADAGERVEIVMRSGDVDSYLRVVTPAGSELTDDDSGGNLDSRVVLVAEESGIHEVYATTVGGGSMGAYSLTFTRAGQGETIVNTSGEITSGDPADVRGNYYDVIEFTASRTGSVIIDVRSDDFDGYAVLKDSSGSILYRDDDSGGNSNPRIEYDVVAGQRYELVVTTYSSETFGAYTVTIYQ